VGTFGGQAGQSAGQATNVVTDFVHIRGESRSHDMRFARRITAAYRQAFQTAGGQVRDHQGRTAKVRFRSQRDYFSFRLKPTAPVVRHACTAIEKAGFQPTLRIANGGLDANWIVRHGIPTITIGAGQNNIHTVGEYVDLAEFVKGCRVALTLATLES